MSTAMLVTLPKRAGRAISQYSIGPGLCMSCPCTTRPASEY